MKPGARSVLYFAALLCVFAGLLFGTPLWAQNQNAAPSRAAAVLDSMPHAQKIDQVALSPDGDRVAYIVDGQLTVTPVNGGSPRPISVEGKLAVRDATWSADSKQLAFLADLPGDIPVAQVWTVAMNAAAGAPVKRAELKGYVQTPRFSPDGRTLAILFIEGLPRMAGPLEPMIPLAGVIDEKVYEERLSTINLSTNKLAQVTPPDVYIYEYDWTPDGAGWVATVAHGSGDANWWVARLYRISAQSGEMHEIYKPKWQMEDPHVSPDGKHVAIIEGIMSDAGLAGGDIVVVPIDGGMNDGGMNGGGMNGGGMNGGGMNGGPARNVSPNIKASPSSLAWASPDRILFAANVDGNSAFGSVKASGGEAEILWTGEELDAAVSDAWVPGGSFSRDGTISAVIRQSAGTPPEVWAGSIGHWKQITHVNSGVEPAWGAMRNIHWMDGGRGCKAGFCFPKTTRPAINIRSSSASTEDHHGRALRIGMKESAEPLRRWAISFSVPTRAAATDKARLSRRRTSRISAAEIIATSWPASTPSPGNMRSTPDASASAGTAMADT